MAARRASGSELRFSSWWMSSKVSVLHNRWIKKLWGLTFGESYEEFHLNSDPSWGEIPRGILKRPLLQSFNLSDWMVRWLLRIFTFFESCLGPLARSISDGPTTSLYVCVAVCCSALQRVAVCCSVVWCVAAWCSVLQRGVVCCSMLQCCTAGTPVC